jgi:type I restriction enzyme S subunit
VVKSIFEQKYRFANSLFSDWKKMKIGDIFLERSERANGDEELLAVTINSGVQKRNDIELKDNSSDDKKNYKKVYVSDIAYNTMRMWQGASGVSAYNGIVSPAYTVITPINKAYCCTKFWAYYFKTDSLIKEFQKYSQGLTSDTWNLKFPQFSEIEVYCPSFDEQCKIAEFLEMYDNRIHSAESILQHLQKYKATLLQQLFI